MSLKSILAATFLSLTSFVGNVAVAAPQAGWWWNPVESGRGFFIESQNGIMFMAAYLYADDGRARWLVSGGANADPYHYAGRLLDVSGGQTLFGAYAAPTSQVDVGAVSVDFKDDTHGTLTWPGGVVAIERDVFGAGQADFLPESGWWWNPAESGSGYSIEVQGNNLFFVGFMYDAAGNPVWYFSAGPMTTVTTYSGALQQFSNGQTLTGAYKAPGTPANVGSLNIAFTAPDTATLTFSGAVAGMNDAQAKAGDSRNITISREFKPVPHPYDYPNSFSGSFAQSVELHTTVGPLDVTITSLAIGTGITWVNTFKYASPPAGDQVTGQLMKYIPAPGGQVVVAVNYGATSSAGISCSGSAAKTFAFKDLLSALLISNLAEYVMQIGMAGDDLQVTVPVTCYFQGQSYAAPPWIAGDAIKIVSPVLYAQDVLLTGSVGPQAITPFVTKTGSWQLVANPNGF